MKDSKDILENEKKYILQTYKRISLQISHGKGVYLYSEDNEKYLDFFSGLAVNALGYGNENVISAIEEQIKKYIHLSNYYANQPQIELAERLVYHSKLDKVFFTNSGTEAVESSLKLIRKFVGSDKKIISFSNAFHGRTYGSLSLSGKEKYRKKFSPLLPGILQLEFNNIEQLENSVDSETAAVYLEFIQGEGGIRVVSNQFIEKLKKLREEYDFILVADEVQSGIGRTGKPFAFNHFEIEPDLVIVAKSIGGGLPLGALITNKRYSEVFSFGDHGSTFGGNPVACAAGLVVINEVIEKGLINAVSKLSDYFFKKLKKIQEENPEQIIEVRGIGFMIGVEFYKSCSGIMEEFLNKKILVNCTNENVLRILPPLISTKDNIDVFLKVFRIIMHEQNE